MQCEQLKEHLADYWAGALSQAERHAVEAHVAACEPCRQEAAELGETWRALGTIADEEPSPALEARFHAMLDAWRDGERAATANAIAASAAGVAGAAGAGANVLTMTPVSRSVSSKGRFSPSGVPSGASRETRATFWRPALQMAAAVLILVGGFAAGRNWPNAAHEQSRNEVSELRGELRGMREMVAMTLLQQDSAIGRLQGVSWSHQLERPSDQVLATLLDTLRHDPNFNVRLASIDALRAFAAEEGVRTGLVDALGSKGTTSPMVQIALIDALTDLRERRSVDALRTLAEDTKQVEAVRQRARRGIQQLSS
jgi:HEAT repeats/Putative zinc-finger